MVDIYGAYVIKNTDADSVISVGKANNLVKL